MAAVVGALGDPLVPLADATAMAVAAVEVARAAMACLEVVGGASDGLRAPLAGVKVKEAVWAAPQGAAVGMG